jgi:flavin reductase (DIM6/NTAB) family NADH-FMN oxidoreductase RutF
MFYDAILNNHGFVVDPVKAIVAPRPIGWISTVSKTGIANLAPYSFFNLFSTSPHYVAFGSGGWKHSLANIRDTREFAVNIANYALRDAVNVSSATVDEVTDEFELAGVAKAPCTAISVSRVAACPAALECKLHQILDLPGDDGRVNDWMVIGRVVGIHIADEFIQDGRVDTRAMSLIARLGYSEYATVSDVWRMRRPN